jgi:hypothetical protein
LLVQRAIAASLRLAQQPKRVALKPERLEEKVAPGVSRPDYSRDSLDGHMIAGSP